MPEIEQDMVDRYNAAGLDVGVKAKVVGEAINRIKEIDVGKCPDDYQDAWNAQLEIMEEWEEALETADMFALPEILKRRENAAKKLTKVARNHGLTEL